MIYCSVTSKTLDSLFYRKFRILEGARKNVAATLAFSFSCRSLVRARAT